MEVVDLVVLQVLQSLVDDDLVKCEKIGTSNYFWCFPRYLIGGTSL